MKKRTRNIFIIVGIILTLCIGLIGYGGWKIYSFFSTISSFSNLDSRNKETPAKIKETKIFKGEIFLQKSEIYKLKKLSHAEIISKSIGISDEKEREKITQSEIAKGIYGYSDVKVCGDEIIAVGEFGGQAFDLIGNFKRDIYFEMSVEKIKILFWTKEHYRQSLDNLKIIDLKNDGKCGFTSYDSISGFTLFDNLGKIVWRFGKRYLDTMQNKSEAEQEKEIYVTKAEVLDLNDDGVSEFIISQKNDGIRAFDITKKEIWFQPDSYPTADFRLADVDSDGKNELIEFQGESSTIRDNATGKVLKKLEIDGGKEDFLVFEDSEGKKSAQLFEIDRNKLILSYINNKILFEAEAPLSEVEKSKDKSNFPSPTPIDLGNGIRIEPVGEGFGANNESVYNPKAVWVRFQKDKSKYLAIIAPFISIPRANFYVYDEKGNLFYHELLAEDAETIAVLPTANAAEEILIGGRETIWKFTIK